MMRSRQPAGRVWLAGVEGKISEDEDRGGATAFSSDSLLLLIFKVYFRSRIACGKWNICACYQQMCIVQLQVNKSQFIMHTSFTVKIMPKHTQCSKNYELLGNVSTFATSARCNVSVLSVRVKLMYRQV